VPIIGTTALFFATSLPLPLIKCQGMSRRFTAPSLKQLAYDLGFTHVGIARAEKMDEEARRLEEWLNRGYHGTMRWMENHFEKRTDPTKLVPGAKTVISLLYNYFPEDESPSETAPKISRYAYGEDYHRVIRTKLRELVGRIEEQLGAPLDGRVFVDSAPVLERDWARRAGIGWVGKNTLLINPRSGSYFFLAEIISDLELPADSAIRDHCGTCTRCIDACPTEAISPGGYVVDGSKCISYLTIELKEAIPETFRGKMEGWAFGCDICQEVCPWNRFSTPHQEPAFQPHPDLPEMEERDWQEMTEEVFRRVFRKSAVKRTKYSGLRRNLNFLSDE
jgi:epoxyqueuosine reductase